MLRFCQLGVAYPVVVTAGVGVTAGAGVAGTPSTTPDHQPYAMPRFCHLGVAFVGGGNCRSCGDCRSRGVLPFVSWVLHMWVEATAGVGVTARAGVAGTPS